MRHSFLHAILAIVSAVHAQNPTPWFDAISSPTQDQNVTAGSLLDIIWEVPGNITGTVNITLFQGPAPNGLTLGPVIACSEP